MITAALRLVVAKFEMRRRQCIVKLKVILNVLPQAVLDRHLKLVRLSEGMAQYLRTAETLLDPQCYFVAGYVLCSQQLKQGMPRQIHQRHATLSAHQGQVTCCQHVRCLGDLQPADDRQPEAQRLVVFRCTALFCLQDTGARCMACGTMRQGSNRTLCAHIMTRPPRLRVSVEVMHGSQPKQPAQLSVLTLAACISSHTLNANVPRSE